MIVKGWPMTHGLENSEEPRLPVSLGELLFGLEAFA